MATLDLFTQLESLKKEQNAKILSHYYQDPDIQDVADFIGGSLFLAQQKTKVEANVILFCGVHFMSETAKILNSGEMVILPDINAGCSQVDSAPPNKMKDWIDSQHDHKVISYINFSAKIKAMSDIICTSSNTERIINSLPWDKKMVTTLKNMHPEITPPEDVRLKVLIKLEKMLALS